MKKVLSSLLILSSLTLASEYYSKLEPVESYNIKSSVSGKVLYVNSQVEGKFVVNDTLVKIDDKINKIELKQTKEKLRTLQEVLSIEEEILESYKKVSSKSKFDKDNQKIKILNIKSSIVDLETKIATLKDSIENKQLKEKNRYIYDINVKEGDYVNPGSVLYTSKDTTSGKLEVFIPIDEAKIIKSKSIYLDGKKTDLKISKFYDIADSKHISSYKCEIVVPKPQTFSKLVKVEFK